VVNGAKKVTGNRIYIAGQNSNHDFLTEEDAGSIAGPGEADIGRIKA
jgi:hypothetical protein